MYGVTKKILNKQLPDLTYGLACRSGHALSVLL